MPVLCERYRNAAGTAAELEDRSAGASCDGPEPVDRRGRTVGSVEVVERREALRLFRAALTAEPVNGAGVR